MKTELIRTWKHESEFVDGKPFELRLFETDRYDERTHRWYLGYELLHGGKPIFDGEDFSPSPMHEVDSDEAVAHLLSFLSLQPGDTDDEYFENYIPEQLEWAKAHGEELSWIAMEMEEELGRG